MEFLSLKQMLLLILLIISFISVGAASALISDASFSSHYHYRNQSDRSALLSFKSEIKHDPFGALTSWNDSIHYCRWQGITCSRRHLERVTALDLPSQKLEGVLSSFIGNLTFLRRLNLTENNLHGEIPQEIGRLFRLQSFNVEKNSLHGEIPENITHCSDLREINLNYNMLSGNILPKLSSLSKLELLYLVANNFTGVIPTSLGNLSSLYALSLVGNQLEGKIPDSLCRIRSLAFFNVGMNKLTGEVPSCLYSLSNIYYFVVQTNKLKGSLPPNVGLTLLPNIEWLFLNDNHFDGHIPASLFSAKNLQLVDLSSNSFSGDIPTNFTGCPNLRVINFNDNILSGKIPAQLSSLLKLDTLNLYNNNLSGNIPTSLGNLSSLTLLSLGKNNLKGSIPNSLFHIMSLDYLGVQFNKLTGEIPSSLFNHSGITTFVVNHNQLEGTIPPNIGHTLPNLELLYMGSNQFSGPIPNSFPNATRLAEVDLSNNNLSGSVPRDLGMLQSLSYLSFFTNQLGTKGGGDLEFITSLTNCSHLEELHFANNILKGPLPNSISNFSTKFRKLVGDSNQIFGKIPVGLGNLANIEFLSLSGNHFISNIPVEMGKLTKLGYLYLDGNFLSGNIPSFLGNMTPLTQLNLSSNNFHGTIPLTLGNCKNIESLDLSHNKLIGTIPTQLTTLPLFSIGLHLNHNFFSGNLPSEVGDLINLMMLDVSKNDFSGKIPESLGKCLNLVGLDLSNNKFEGKVPTKSLSTLKGLKYLDLSQNNLSGEIPEYLENFPLQYLNLSFNEFEGKVPMIGVFGNVSVVSIAGNKKLCGGTTELKLRPCLNKIKKKPLFVKWIIPLIVGSLFLLVLSCTFLVCCQKKRSVTIPSSTTLFDQSYRRTSYSELYKATNGFSTENLIGIGSYGAVFKGNLQGINKMIAVKVFNLQTRGASISFLTECNALRNIRHRNLLKIITSCSSIDFQGNEFKALVSRFMPNMSLHHWLHEITEGIQVDSRVMSFIQRLKVSINVASALEYLHHHCQPAIVHCDVKPSNVLLDEDMTACLADFGIAKIFSNNFDDSGQSNNKSAGIKGSIGYVAPEYGMGGEVTKQGDVYSYGILLLEIFTGKKPTHDMFLNGLTLHNYAKMAFPNHVIGIIEPLVLMEDNDNVLNTVRHNSSQGRLHDCLVTLVRIGVACSVESPIERMTMSAVVNELHRVISYYQSVISNSE